MKSPFAIALSAAAVVLAIAFALPVLHMLRGGAPPPPAAQGLPWQVQRHGDGITVFGLDLPGSTLADAQRRWGDELELAVMAPIQRLADGGALEAYVERFDSAGVGGRLLLATALPADRIAQLRAHAVKDEPVDAEARRFTLRADDRAQALQAPLAGITFIPAANLDADVLRQRFGAPAERLRSSPRLEHWLYPALGLAIVLDAEGKEVLQYVAPADFDRRLRAPLIAAGATPLPP